MTTLNLYEAKTQLSKLVDRVAAGEEIVIAKAGKPMARLVLLAQPRARKSGFLKGQIWIADDFDETPEEIIRDFEDSEIFPPDEGADHARPQALCLRRRHHPGLIPLKTARAPRSPRR